MKLTKKEVNKKIAKLCSECNGKCCRNVFVSRKEFEKLKKEFPKLNYKKLKGGFLLKGNPKCQFLIKGKGCSLNNEIKPIDCKIYPLVFLTKKDGLHFYLTNHCPYYKKFPREWINENKKFIKRKLKEWTAEEIKDYSKIQEKHKKELVKV